MMEIAKNSLAVNLPDGSALIYQALHLAKVSAVYGQIVKNGGFVRKWLARKKAITDKMGKNSRLSVKCVLLTDKSAKNGTLSVI